ncbi:hypothetical protein [Acinetobacter bouvetii]|uniref:Uncharacterized protein n=1 Tax=Acinetobacter bouvetii TaxID=202951 RepID=A0A811G7X0_9GAMM|nr:hypothetical protein [Acinetobacter bouvetii]CAB1211874.1 hypothetical protein SFB21_0967 [Acinetobacter bouvetii]
MTNNIILEKTLLSSTEYMQQFRQRFHSPEHQHKFYIASALKTVDLDGSFTSFKRLDQMFEAFKKQVGSLEINEQSNPAQIDTLKLLASHVGSFLAIKSGQTEKWLNREDLAEKFPQLNTLPTSFVYDVAIELPHKVLFPLLIVQQQFKQAQPERTISQQLETELLQLLVVTAANQNKVAEEMHAIQHMYQNSIPFSCGINFENLVRISDLDYSLKSLDRLDELMRELRQNYIVSPQAFLSEQSNFYFILYLSGYLGRVIAQHAGCALRWLTPQQVSRIVNNEVPTELVTLRVAQIHDRIYFTTGHITDFLFSSVIQTSSLQYAKGIIQELLVTRPPIYAVKQTSNTAQKESPINQALHQAGFLLGFVFQKIHGVLPRYNAEDNITPTTFPAGQTFYAHLEGPDPGLKELEQNPANHPYNVLAYEMYACLPHLRTDAISLHIRNYGEHAINLHLVVPFFPIFHYQGFEIIQPYVSASDLVTQQQMPQILNQMHAFFAGIEDYESVLPDERKVWKHHYKPEKHPYPSGFSENA